LVHRGHRSAESIEYRQARFFCFRNSKFDCELQERVFCGEQADVEFFVDLFVDNLNEGDLPECPKGLVLADNRARGAFDVHPEFDGKERFVDDQ
jgi:hypothetical protein